MEMDVGNDLKIKLIEIFFDKFIMAVLVLVAAYLINRSFERFKSEILKRNKISEIKYTKISEIIECIWDCNASFNKLCVNFAKKHEDGSGPFKGIAELKNNNSEFMESINSLIQESGGEFSESTNKLKRAVNSSYFWIGDDLYKMAEDISDKYIQIAYSIVNGDPSGKTKIIVQDMDENVRKFEIKCIAYFD
jgi:hypothetical protein